ncbi:MAG: rRNA maturation RNase YbeY [bacterium]
MTSTILLTVEPDVRSLVDRTLRRRLKRRAHRMLTAVGLESAELSVLLAGDRTVARLNETWRRKRGTTDVLSFAQAAPELLRQWSAGASAAADADAPDRVLGDLVISLDVVHRRSPRPEGYEQDLVTLLAHGLLHLLGFEHADLHARKHMLSLQDELVQIATSRGRIPRLVTAHGVNG